MMFVALWLVGTALVSMAASTLAARSGTRRPLLAVPSSVGLCAAVSALVIGDSGVDDAPGLAEILLVLSVASRWTAFVLTYAVLRHRLELASSRLSLLSFFLAIGALGLVGFVMTSFVPWTDWLYVVCVLTGTFVVGDSMAGALMLAAVTVGPRHSGEG